MRKSTLGLAVLLLAVLVMSLGAGAAEVKTWVVGFSQIGAESEWRNANTFSIQNAIGEDPTLLLIFSDAQQKQENQIKALRSFIARRVDVIVFTALVETGYGPVLKEAKEAGIPVIMIDRDVAEEDRHLRLCIMGSDFVEEGRKAARWLGKYLKEQGLDDGKKQINIVELQGTVGSAPAIDRKLGFEEVIAAYPGMKIIKSATGDFTRSKGKEVMAAFLQEQGRNINALFAHNDDMAIGAIQAIEEYGLRPGVDIIIVSVDAIRAAFEAMIEGKLNCTVECNPLLGRQFFDAVEAIIAGKKIPKRIVVEEGVFPQEVAKEVLPTRRY